MYPLLYILLPILFFNFTTNNSTVDGVNDSGAIVSGYNSWATADCTSTSGGSDTSSCCLYEDYYGSGNGVHG